MMSEPEPTKTSIEKYSELKFEYFDTLNAKGIRKGDVRAFIGLRTWLYERERSESGEGKYDSHITAFEDAVNDFKTLIEKRKFFDVFKKDKEEWVKNGRVLKRESGGKPLLPPPIPNMTNWKGNGLSLISLFSGALGLDLGFLAAGFDLRLANDIDQHSYNTVKNNLPFIPFIHKDFTKVSVREVLDKAGLSVGDVDVLTGGPPCQPFSTAGRRRDQLAEHLNK